MILVKRSNLLILSALIGALLVMGELRFFFALKSVDLSGNLQVKYEIESFIFASVVFTLIVALFFIYFLRRSMNILKTLDKMIEISEFGEHDISAHLKQLGRFGEKIASLLFHFKELNDMKSLKISSLACIGAILIEKNDAPLFLLNRHGNIVNCSERLLSMLNVTRGRLIKSEMRSLFKNMNYEELFFDLEKSRAVTRKTGIVTDAEGNETRHSVDLYPVANAEGLLSHIIGIVV
ncbi:MAG: PAS domain-containing protein [Candidatus Omnitrophota bacterium]